VRLEEGVEGLIHISELAEGNFLHPRNVVHEHDIVRVRVLSVDVSHRRLGLSLRQAHNNNGAVTAPEELLAAREDQI
jgi:small subunit ribosomal protein S1